MKPTWFRETPPDLRYGTEIGWGQETSMSDPNLDYLQARARHERNIAIASEDNCAALAHLRMADEYERRAQMLKDAAQPDRPRPTVL